MKISTDEASTACAAVVTPKSFWSDLVPKTSAVQAVAYDSYSMSPWKCYAIRFTSFTSNNPIHRILSYVIIPSSSLIKKCLSNHLTAALNHL